MQQAVANKISNFFRTPDFLISITFQFQVYTTSPKYRISFQKFSTAKRPMNSSFIRGLVYISPRDSTITDTNIWWFLGVSWSTVTWLDIRNKMGFFREAMQGNFDTGRYYYNVSREQIDNPQQHLGIPER